MSWMMICNLIKHYYLGDAEAAAEKARAVANQAKK
jgi:hypothetical protein